MNQKRRVLEVAKEFHLSSKEALEIFNNQLGLEFKSHFNAVSDEVYEKFSLQLQSKKKETLSSERRPQIKIRRRQSVSERIQTVSERISSSPQEELREEVVKEAGENNQQDAQSSDIPLQKVGSSDPEVSSHSSLQEDSRVEEMTSPSPSLQKEKVKEESSEKEEPSPLKKTLQMEGARTTSSRTTSGFRAATIIRKAPSESRARPGEKKPGIFRPSSSRRVDFQNSRGPAGGPSSAQGQKKRVGGFPLKPGASAWTDPLIRPAEDGKSRRLAKSKVKVKDKRDFEPLGNKKSLQKKSDVLTVDEDVIRRKRKKKESRVSSVSKKVIHLSHSISVSTLAQDMGLKVAAVINTLMKLGNMATANQLLDVETATLVAEDMGYQVKVETQSLDSILGLSEKKENMKARPPVIVVMGHVDHGKTSLLDRIRKSNVAEGESGGITQRIGAYQVSYREHLLSFLDTPGHEAFTAMRSRGAEITDLVVLVVAADDGLMPQTREAIAHAKAAECPIIVAINKIDKPGYNLDKIKAELVEAGLLLEEWGGDVLLAPVSAKTGEGISDLLDAILLQTELLDLKAPSEGLARGVIIEARLDRWKGPVATLMVQEGCLKVSDKVLVGSVVGRVRSLQSFDGQSLKEAYPSQPVEISGLDGVPVAGDPFYVVENEDVAKQALQFLKLNRASGTQAAFLKPISSLDLLGQDTKHYLKLIVKADSQGTLEAVVGSIKSLSTEKIVNQIIHQGVGLVNESDLSLAKASQAVLVAFNTKLETNAAALFEREKLTFLKSGVIYELKEQVEKLMLGELAPVQKEESLGEAELRHVFHLSKVGLVAGVMITQGKVQRQCSVRVKREGNVVFEGRIESLQRFKQEVKEVLQGFECGLQIPRFEQMKEGDRLEFFQVVEEAASSLI